MKILVYGCGVIGSLMVHTLCRAGNDVTVVSKGAWGDVLQKNGLRIHHQLQRKDTVDHPKVAKELPDG
jgi:2-dehydropantoate 2-reductase